MSPKFFIITRFFPKCKVEIPAANVPSPASDDAVDNAAVHAAEVVHVAAVAVDGAAAVGAVASRPLAAAHGYDVACCHGIDHLR